MTERRESHEAGSIGTDAAIAARSAEAEAGYADRRTELAAVRTVLAAERTYAAWVRTGLAALAAGVGAKALLDDAVPHRLAGLAGVTLLLFSAFCFVAAVWRELSPGLGGKRPALARVPPALLIGVNGVLLLVALAAAVGVALY